MVAFGLGEDTNAIRKTKSLGRRRLNLFRYKESDETNRIPGNSELGVHAGRERTCLRQQLRRPPAMGGGRYAGI
jgi:hypothetical protein